MARRKYPWEVWFGQPRTVLVRGVDYKLSQFMMCQTIVNNRWRCKYRVNVKDIGTAIVINVAISENEDEISHTDKVTVTTEYEDALAGNGESEEETTSCYHDLHEKSNAKRGGRLITSSNYYYKNRPTKTRQ